MGSRRVKVYGKSKIGRRIGIRWTPTYIKTDEAGWWRDRAIERSWGRSVSPYCFEPTTEDTSLSRCSDMQNV